MQKNCLVIGKVFAVIAFTLPLLGNPSHAHSGSATSAAWEVCDGKEKSNYCEYQGFHGETYIGSCQSIAYRMMCVRNKPILPADPDFIKNKDDTENFHQD